jgi:hypothetical protein
MKTWRNLLSFGVTAALLAAGTCWGCGDEDEETEAVEFSYAEDLPEGPTLYVSADCADGEGDGTIGAPLCSVGQALEVAEEGTIIALAAGTFKENVVVHKNVQLIGAGVARSAIEGTGDQATLAAAETDGLVVRDLTLKGTGPIGFHASGLEKLTLIRVVALGYKKTEAGPGAGFQIDSVSDLTLDGIEASSNGQFGVVLNGSVGTMKGALVSKNGLGQGSAGLALRGGSHLLVGDVGVSLCVPPDCSEMPAGPGDTSCTFDGNDGWGIFVEASNIELSGAWISNNKHGGVAFFGAMGEESSPSVSNCVLTGNVEYGLMAYGSEASFTHNWVRGAGGQAEAMTGHCISAILDGQDDLAVEITGNAMESCPGVAAFVSGGNGVTVSDNRVVGAAAGGIWIQGGAKLFECKGNVVEDVTVVGLALDEGVYGKVEGNAVASTLMGKDYIFERGLTVEAGDGMIIRGQPGSGGISLKGNRITGCARAGLIIDGFTGEQVTFDEGNVVAGNLEAGISLQHGGQEIAQAQTLATLVSFQAEGFEPNGGFGDITTEANFPLPSPRPKGNSPELCVPPDCSE